MKKVIGIATAALVTLGVVGAMIPENDTAQKTQSSPQPESSQSESAETNTSPEPEPEVKAETTVSEPAPEPAPAPAPKPQSNCDPNYSPCVPIVSYDLDCPDVGFTVTVVGYDKHRLDRDGDGYGCESY